jgi:hypothetical protein
MWMTLLAVVVALPAAACDQMDDFAREEKLQNNDIDSGEERTNALGGATAFVRIMMDRRAEFAAAYGELASSPDATRTFVAALIDAKVIEPEKLLTRVQLQQFAKGKAIGTKRDAAIERFEIEPYYFTGKPMDAGVMLLWERAGGIRSDGRIVVFASGTGECVPENKFQDMLKRAHDE